MNNYLYKRHIAYILCLVCTICFFPNASTAQEEDIVEKLGLESYEVKFGVSRGVAHDYSTFRDGDRWTFLRLSDTTMLRTFQMVSFEDRRLFSPMGGTFIEISRSFKPFKNEMQLNLGLRHSRNILRYDGLSRVNEVYTEVIDTLFVEPPSTEPTPLIVDGLECDTLLPRFDGFDDDPTIILGSVTLTSQITKPFFNRKLFVSAGGDLLFSYFRSHYVATEELFAYQTPFDNGVQCGYRVNRRMLDALPVPKVVVHGGVQFFPHPRFGVELQVRKHVLNIFPDGSSFEHRPMSFQLGWIVRLQDDFISQKKLARQERKLAKNSL